MVTAVYTTNMAGCNQWTPTVNPRDMTHVRNWKNYLILALFVTVGILLFLRSCQAPPVVDLREIAYQDTIRVLREQAAQVQAQQDTIFARVRERTKRDSITIINQDKRIAEARRRERDAVVKISDQTKQDHPEVVEALAAKDTTIMELIVKIDTLQEQNGYLKEQLAALQHLDVQEDEIQSRMMQECGTRVDELTARAEKAEKKAAKVPVLKRVVVWLIGGLFVETVILLSN